MLLGTAIHLLEIGNKIVGAQTLAYVQFQTCFSVLFAVTEKLVHSLRLIFH